MFYTSTNSTPNERMRITSGGNVGINTTGNTTSTPHLFIGTNLSMFNGGSDDSYFGSNFYYNSAWLYRTANKASMIQQDGGSIVFKNTDTTGTAGGALTWSERMRITSGGNVLVGTTTDGGAKLQVSGNTSMSQGLYIGSTTDPLNTFRISGNVISNNAGTYPLKWNSSTGSVTYDGSSRLGKKDIINSPYGLAEILKLTSRKYYRIDDNKEEIGLIADEVQSIMPEFVPMVPKSLFTKIATDTELIAGGVNYDKLTSVLIKGMQEQNLLIQELKAEIEILKNK